MRKQTNQGSAVIEVTLIMPILLLIMVLMITLLLSVWKQAEIHMKLVTYSAEQRLGGSVCTKEPEGMVQSAEKDCNIYSAVSELELLSQYGISVTLNQTMRDSDTQQVLRRWQLVEAIISE